jgi:hypothetical protein
MFRLPFTVVPVPVFDSIGKTFSLDKNTLNDLAAAGLGRFNGKVPSGSMVLVGYTGSWWRGAAATPKLGLNLNWVVVIGAPP